MKGKGIFKLVGGIGLAVLIALPLMSACAAPAPAPAPAPEVEFPVRSVEIVAPFGVGGAFDTLSRKMAAIWTDYIGVPIYVVNVPGASGDVALARLDEQPSDGYNVCGCSTDNIVAGVLGTATKDIRDYVPIALMQMSASLMFCRGDAPWQTFDELLETAKEKEVTVAVTYLKSGDSVHLEYINSKLGTKFKPIGYKVPTERYAALPSGEVDLLIEQWGDVRHLTDGGEARGLVFFYPERDPGYSDVPSSWEYDLPVSAPMWRAFVVKPGTPQAAVDKLIATLEQTNNDSRMKDFHNQRFAIGKTRSGDDFGKFLDEQWELISNIAKECAWI